MTKAERIRSYMEDSGMSRAEAKALVEFEGDDSHHPRCTCAPCEDARYPHFDTEAERDA